MSVPLNQKWQTFVDEAVRTGRFPSSAAVVEEGLRLVAERERRQEELRAHLEAAIAEGGSFTDAEIEAELEARVARRLADRG